MLTIQYRMTPAFILEDAATSESAAVVDLNREELEQASGTMKPMQPDDTL